jgi:hypothetical protein
MKVVTRDDTQSNALLDADKTSTGQRRLQSGTDSLPGQPRMAPSQVMKLNEYVQQAFVVPELEVLAPWLWIVST